MSSSPTNERNFDLNNDIDYDDEFILNDEYDGLGALPDMHMPVPLSTPNCHVQPSVNIPTPVSSIPPPSNNEEVPREKRQRSDIWQYFESTNDPKRKKYKHCKNTYAFTGKNGTSSLLRHAKGQNGAPPSCPILRRDKKQPQISTAFGEIRTHKFNQQVSRDALAKAIILHEYPFKIVTYVGFIDFIKTLEPSFKMISAPTIRSDCVKIYESEKIKMVEIFSKIPGKISITSDLWTSIQNLGYMSVTAHFIDHEWNLNKRIIGFYLLEYPHNAENIAKGIQYVLESWKIEDKIGTITLDNASVNDRAVGLLKYELSKISSLPLDGNLFHQRCSAHILNLIVKHGLEKIDNSIKNVRDAVKYVKASPSRKNTFNLILRDINLVIKKGLVLDVSTRWNSTFLMLQAALPYKKAFDRLKEVNPRFISEPPNDNDWKVTEDVSNFLSIFNDVTLKFSATKITTSNLFLLEIVNIRKKLYTNSYLSSNCFSVIHAMRTYFEKYWNPSMSNFYSIALLLDPQYKLIGVKYMLSLLFGNLIADPKVERGVEDLKKLFDIYKNKNDTVVATPNIENINGCGSSHRSVESDFDDFLAELGDNEVMEKTEVDVYLEEKKEKRRDDFNILEWWKVNCHRFPILSIIARDILAVPVSTVASESAFSTGGRVLDSYRSSLLPNMVEKLICAQDWIRGGSNIVDFENIDCDEGCV